MIAAALVVNGCAVTTVPPAVIVKTDVTQVYGIDWLDAETLVVQYATDDTAATRLGTVPVLGGDLTPLPVQTDQSCLQERLATPLVMSSGAIALTYLCHEKATDSADRVSLITIQPPSTKPEEIGNVGVTGYPPSQIATSPDGLRQLVGLGSLCGIIVEASPTGPIPLDVTVSDAGQSFRLDDLTPDPGCSSRGWAKYPAWSPDGAQISLFAAPAAIGKSGPPRAEVPASLYTIQPNATSGTVVRRDIRHPRGLDYSPDGRRLAFGAEIGGRSGIWVLDLESGNLMSVHDRSVDWLAWASDGKRIAATEPGVDDPPFPTQIIVVDVAEHT